MSSPFSPQTDPFRWEGIPMLAYKEDGTHFKSITRQVLFEGDPEQPLSCQLRYFEIAPGGHSTLEKHEHVHAVMILRGEGETLVGSEIRHLRERDLVYIPPHTWHQFRATKGGPYGFLCMVNSSRDRPHRPDESDLASLREDPAIAEFIRV